jgi:hypothetical protein
MQIKQENMMKIPDLLSGKKNLKKTCYYKKI